VSKITKSANELDVCQYNVKKHRICHCCM